MLFSLDTSSLIGAWTRRMPPDIVPSLWQNLERAAQLGDIRASEEVSHELALKEDGLYKWAKGCSNLFCGIDDEVQIVVTRILKSHPKLLDTRKNRSGADPFVIALAYVHNAAVVTEERASNSPRRPNIPDVCIDLGVRCLDIFDVARHYKWRF